MIVLSTSTFYFLLVAGMDGRYMIHITYNIYLYLLRGIVETFTALCTSPTYLPRSHLYIETCIGTNLETFTALSTSPT